MVDDAILALTRKYPELHVNEAPGAHYLTFSVMSHDGRHHTWDIDRSYIMQLPTHIIFTQILSWLHKIGYTDSNGNPMGRNLVFKTPPFMQEYGTPAYQFTTGEGGWDKESIEQVAFREKKKPVRMGKWGVKLD